MTFSGQRETLESERDLYYYLLGGEYRKENTV